MEPSPPRDQTQHDSSHSVEVPQRLVMTTSRYSLGTTIVPSSDVFVLLIRSTMSCASVALPASSIASKTRFRQELCRLGYSLTYLQQTVHAWLLALKDLMRDKLSKATVVKL